MEFLATPIKDVKIIVPKVYCDCRGNVMEAYHEEIMNKNGITSKFIQDNISTSVKGVLRGVHTQIKHPQAKIVGCISGAIYDVVVDCRIESPTFGKWYGDVLTSENYRQMFVPEGVAHGFYTLEDATIWMKVTTHYTPGDEIGFMWNDENINIEWPFVNNESIILAEKDKKWGTFKDMINELQNAI